MGIKLVGISEAKEKLRRTLSPRKGSISTSNDVPKGHFPVYVGEAQRRFVVPISYLRHPLFQELLHWAEQEFGIYIKLGMNMGIRLQTMVGHAKQVIVGARARKVGDVPKGHMAVYVGDRQDEEKHRFVVPIRYLKHPLFQNLLRLSEEEYGFQHPMGGLTIPCTQSAFLTLTSKID
nr:Auxin responsive SAUR protein [Ipomoea batatas]